MAKRKNIYNISPIGEALYPWINNADTEFNDAGVFKVDLRLTGKDAADLREDVDEKAQAGFDELTADMTAGERKKFTIYRPYEVEEDDEGNPTGAIIFRFRQNATIKLKDGTEKKVQIGVQDSEGNDTRVAIFGGSKLRVLYSARPIKVVSSKQAGVRLDFSMVQIAELAKSSGPKFGKIDGGFVSRKDAASEASGDDGHADTGGDY